FIGEFLILQGVFVASRWWAAFAASGVVLGAAYMLYLYQRTMFGKIENPKNEALPDLSHREFATFAPLLILAVWMVLFPSPFIRRLDTSVQHIVARVSPQYAAKNAADCATPAPAVANPAAKFLESLPCDRGLDTSVQHIVARVSPQYAAKNAADCATPAPAVANPAAKFLESLPC